jgi:hypothetical protein
LWVGRGRRSNRWLCIIPYIPVFVETVQNPDSEVLNFFVVVYNVAVSLRLGNHHKYQSASEKYKQYDMEALKQAVLKISSVTNQKKD